MLLKYGCAFQSSVFVKSCCTPSPPYSPGGRLIECTTMRSMAAPCGRAPKFGEARRRAKRYQPPSHSDGTSAVVIVVVAAAGHRDRLPRDAVADLPQRQAELLRGGRAVVIGLAQRLHENRALLLVPPRLQILRHAGRGLRRRGLDR